MEDTIGGVIWLVFLLILIFFGKNGARIGKAAREAARKLEESMPAEPAEAWPSWVPEQIEKRRHAPQSRSGCASASDSAKTSPRGLSENRTGRAAATSVLSHRAAKRSAGTVRPADGRAPEAKIGDPCGAMEQEGSGAAAVRDEFDLRTAVIYSEILNPKFRADE